MDIYQKVEKFYESAKTKKTVVGKSLFGRDIFAVKMGEGSPVGIAQYAIHGREYITAELAFSHFERGVYKGSIWLIPLVNPDGALLSEVGLSSVEDEEQKRMLLRLNGGENFSLWKANGRGVDLNVNFPARYGTGAKNTKTAGAENYVGEFPCSEPESSALKKFTEKIRPDYTVSYHTKGEEIYWYFYQSTHTCHRDKEFGEVLSRSTGYPLADAGNSAGGYKDWCIQRFQIPAFTIEAGRDEYKHPLKAEALTDIIEKNRSALYELSKEI